MMPTLAEMSEHDKKLIIPAHLLIYNEVRMKRFSFVKIISVILFTVIISGCSWTRGRVENQGHVFPATTLSSAMWACQIPPSITMKSFDDPVGELAFKIVLVPPTIVYGIVDFAVSFTTDVVLLPIDLLVQNDSERKSIADYCSQVKL